MLDTQKTLLACLTANVEQGADVKSAHLGDTSIEFVVYEMYPHYVVITLMPDGSLIECCDDIQTILPNLTAYENHIKELFS